MHRHGLFPRLCMALILTLTVGDVRAFTLDDVRALTAGDVKEDVEDCNNYIHQGVEQVYRGIDVTDFDILPMIGSSTNQKNQLFHNTDSCLNYDNFWDFMETYYNGTIIIAPSDTFSVRSWATESEHNARSFEKDRVGYVGAYEEEKKAFSHSPSVRKAINDLNGGTRGVFGAMTVERKFKVPFTDNLKLLPSVLAQINELNATFESNEQAYNEFIESFGTHYIDRAFFGSVKRIQLIIDRDHFSQLGAHSVMGSLRSFMQYGIPLPFVNETSGNITIVRKSYGDEQMAYMYETDVKPIYRLFEDSDKYSNMKRAVKEYIERRYANQ